MGAPTLTFKKEIVDIKIVEILELSIPGTEDEYSVKLWIDDEELPDGGSFQAVTKKHKQPMLILNFHAKVDVDLTVGSIYFAQDKTYYYVTEPNIIRNVSRVVKSFEIPKQLLYLTSPTYREYG